MHRIPRVHAWAQKAALRQKLPLGDVVGGIFGSLSDDNIYRTDKLSLSYDNTEVGPLCGMGIAVIDPKLFDLVPLQQNGIRDFRPLSEAYHAEMECTEAITPSAWHTPDTQLSYEMV